MNYNSSHRDGHGERTLLSAPTQSNLFKMLGKILAGTAVMALSVPGASAQENLIKPRNSLETTLLASALDGTNKNAYIKFHNTILQSPVFIAVNKETYDLYPKRQGTMGVIKFFSITMGNGTRALAIFSNAEIMSKVYPSGGYSISVSGKNAFALAAQNNESIILNYNTPPSITWTPQQVRDFLK